MMRHDLLHPGLNGAFVADGFGSLPVSISQVGRKLAGKRLAVKDVFDVEGLLLTPGCLCGRCWSRARNGSARPLPTNSPTASRASTRTTPHPRIPPIPRA